MRATLGELTLNPSDPARVASGARPVTACFQFPLHLLPADFDMPELLCSPIDMAAYNRKISNSLLSTTPKK